jgi:hypothetical protein
MLISICTPVMKRLDDLKRVMPYRLQAARVSLPVEFVILNYNSQDGLEDYVIGELSDQCYKAGVLLTYRRYMAREHYHQAHAYNLAAMSAHGQYICIMGADTYPSVDYFPVIREMEREGCYWMEDKRYKGAVCVKWVTFQSIGGYDERFEFYGAEDRDLAIRLSRLGVKKGTLPKGLIGNIPTPDEIKMANYRLKMSKRESSRKMREVFDENFNNNVIVVNQGKRWASWS